MRMPPGCTSLRANWANLPARSQGPSQRPTITRVRCVLRERYVCIRPLTSQAATAQRFSSGEAGKNPGFVARDDPSDAKRRENRALADFVGGMLRCCECGMVTRDTRSWRAYLTDDKSPQAVVYCPTCASREFDR